MNSEWEELSLSLSLSVDSYFNLNFEFEITCTISFRVNVVFFKCDKSTYISGTHDVILSHAQA